MRTFLSERTVEDGLPSSPFDHQYAIPPVNAR
jgi:hypothetical protein